MQVDNAIELKNRLTPQRAFERVFGIPVEQATPKQVIDTLRERFDAVYSLHSTGVAQDGAGGGRRDYFAMRGISDWDDWHDRLRVAKTAFFKSLWVAQRFVAEDLSFLQPLALPHLRRESGLSSQSLIDSRHERDMVVRITEPQENILKGNITLLPKNLQLKN